MLRLALPFLAVVLLGGCLTSARHNPGDSCEGERSGKLGCSYDEDVLKCSVGADGKFAWASYQDCASGYTCEYDGDAAACTAPSSGGGSSAGGGGGTCCKHCGSGSKPCGDSCISVSYTCNKGPGCACY